MRFDHKAHLYDQYSHVQEALADWGAHWLPPSPLKDSRILELGAGTGIFTRHLVEHFRTLEASDIAANMIEQGKTHFPTIVWTQKNAWDLHGGPWDWLCSSSLLQWVPQAEFTLKTWQQCLTPKGRVLANFYTQGTLQELNSISPTHTPLQWQDASWWVDAFLAAGLRPIRHETTSKRMLYDSPIALLRSLHHTGAFDPRKTSYPRMRQLIEQYAQKFSADGKIYATWIFTRIEAENSSD